MRFATCFNPSGQSRRHFFRTAAASSLMLSPEAHAADPELNVFGPRAGYSPQIGTLVSEMAWMRNQVLRAVHGMNQTQFDFLLDNKANRIVALLLHLAATERLYQLATLENVQLDNLSTNAAFKEWAVPMSLGEPARQSIKGHNLDYYLNVSV